MGVVGVGAATGAGVADVAAAICGAAVGVGVATVDGAEGGAAPPIVAMGGGKGADPDGGKVAELGGLRVRPEPPGWGAGGIARPLAADGAGSFVTP